jgi:hypothetical protein
VSPEKIEFYILEIMVLSYQMSYQFSYITPVDVDANEWDIKGVGFSSIHKSVGSVLKIGRILADSNVLHLKTPFMYCPFGASRPYNPAGPDDQKWTLQMNIEKNSNFHKKIEEFDTHMINEISKPAMCAQFLGAPEGKPYSRDVVETKYCQMLRLPADRGCCQQVTRSPPFIRVCVPITECKPNKVACTIYNKNKVISSVELDQIFGVIPPGSWCSATLVGTLWCSHVTFGVVWYVKQLVVYPTLASIPATWKAIREVEDEVEIKDDDDEDEDEDMPELIPEIRKAIREAGDSGMPELIPVTKCYDRAIREVMYDSSDEEDMIVRKRDDVDIRKIMPLSEAPSSVKDMTVAKPIQVHCGPFKLKCTGPDTLFITPSKYVLGEDTTVSQYDLHSRFYRELNGCFDGFDWDHVCIAGGLLTGLIDKKYDPTVYNDSDIDVFVYGITPGETKQHFSRVFKFFQNKFDDLWVVPLKGDNIMVVNLCTKQSRRVIQLIGMTDTNGPRQLIDHFDLSHCQIAFDGNEFLWTQEFMDTMCSRQSQILRPRTSAYRLYKSYMRGFSVMIPKHPVHVTSAQDQDMMSDYGFDIAPSTNNLSRFTIGELLSADNLALFAKKPFNSRTKDQYIKNGLVIQGTKCTDWLTNYVKTHKPMSM